MIRKQIAAVRESVSEWWPEAADWAVVECPRDGRNLTLDGPTILVGAPVGDILAVGATSDVMGSVWTCGYPVVMVDCPHG